MEKILQSIVKIIIVGVLYEANVFCTRSFLPPLPYYQNEPYYVPSYISPYEEYAPIYIQPNIPPPPPPLSYQNTNTYTREIPPQRNNYHPPQLFYKNENYHPLPPPGVNYPVTPFASYPHNYKASYTMQAKPNYKTPQKSNLIENKPEQPKVQVYTSNIILKDEPYHPYYQDEYNKNYQEDDYSDNYTDDAPVQQDPCPVNFPYRNFEPSPASYHPSERDKYTLCNPYFQPNFGNSVYTVKAPITLLPSRFPPRVEEFVQRIQNYFSTYAEKETPKPENQTSTTLPPPSPSTEASSVLSSTNDTSSQVEDANKTNTSIIQELEPSPSTNSVNDTEKVSIELEFVGKNTLNDEKESAQNLTPTEEFPNVQESTINSDTGLSESSTPEVTEASTEKRTEVQNDVTPVNEIPLEVTDKNG